MDVTGRLTPRHRTTLLGREEVGRAAGSYEQCDQPAGRHVTSPAYRGGLGGSLVASGMVGQPGRLMDHVLRSLAGSDRLIDFDTRIIQIADLFSECRLDARAELIMWEGFDGSRIAVPISRLLGDGSTLVLGGPDHDARPQWALPVTLCSASLPNEVDTAVVAFSAITFLQFIGREQ